MLAALAAGTSTLSVGACGLAALAGRSVMSRTTVSVPDGVVPMDGSVSSVATPAGVGDILTVET